MAVRRRKAARRRSASSGNGLPGWAWLLTGAVLALGVVVLAPRYFKSDGVDGFFRAPSDTVPQPPISTLEHPVPPPAPEATPVPADVPAAAGRGAERSAADTQPPPAAPPTEPDYDFYTILPEQETVTSAGAADAAEPAAARTETAPVHPAVAVASSTPPAPSPPASPAERPAASPAALPRPPASATRTPATAPAASAARPAAERATPAAAAASTPSAATASARTASATTPTGSGQRTLLQAGAFRAAGDAEALKARIALLGLQARVEPGSVDGQTVYRVRLGPYANARELTAARQRLDEDGLPSREVRGQ